MYSHHIASIASPEEPKLVHNKEAPTGHEYAKDDDKEELTRRNWMTMMMTRRNRMSTRMRKGTRNSGG